MDVLFLEHLASFLHHFGSVEGVDAAGVVGSDLALGAVGIHADGEGFAGVGDVEGAVGGGDVEDVGLAGFIENFDIDAYHLVVAVEVEIGLVVGDGVGAGGEGCVGDDVGVEGHLGVGELVVEEALVGHDGSDVDVVVVAVPGEGAVAGGFGEVDKGAFEVGFDALAGHGGAFDVDFGLFADGLDFDGAGFYIVGIFANHVAAIDALAAEEDGHEIGEGHGAGVNGVDGAEGGELCAVGEVKGEDIEAAHVLDGDEGDVDGVGAIDEVAFVFGDYGVVGVVGVIGVVGVVGRVFFATYHDHGCEGNDGEELGALGEKGVEFHVFLFYNDVYNGG